MSTARHLRPGRSWLRVLVLLLALLAPGEAYAVPSTPVECVTPYDGVEAALPPLLRTVHRRVVAPRPPLRPSPLPAPAPDRAEPLFDAVLPRTPHTLRTVVLRC
ncbi:hypothetical protein ABZT17_40200 [Streptomyces sp. NPDC005648]|uniref:hypothetical protein n=1 Tax=Streptomyces sp. NPDC005648 TaxID=3157044 RepID=UPI0033B613DA